MERWWCRLRSRSELLILFFLLTVLLLAGRALGGPVCSCQGGTDAGSYCGYGQLTDNDGSGAKQDWTCDISCSKLIPGPGPIRWEYFIDRVEIYFLRSSSSGHGTYSYSGASTLTFEECYYNLDGSLTCKSIWSPRSFSSSNSISFSSYYTGDQGPDDRGLATLDSGYYLFRLGSSRSSYRSHLEVYWGSASAWNSIYFWLTAVTYNLGVTARVEGQAIGNGFVGGFDVSGNLVSGKLTFSGGNVSGTITGSGRPGTSYAESVPRVISLYPVKRVLSGRWNPGTGDFTTQDSYTGTFNISYTWSFTSGGGQYQAWLYACKEDTCRQLYYIYDSGSGGSVTISNVQLNGEKLRAVAQAWSIDLDPSGNYYKSYTGGSLQVSIIGNTPVSLYFAYWDTPGGRVYNTTLTGTLNSDTQVTAVYTPLILGIVAEVANYTLPQGVEVSGSVAVSGTVSGLLNFSRSTFPRTSVLVRSLAEGAPYAVFVPSSAAFGLVRSSDRFSATTKACMNVGPGRIEFTQYLAPVSFSTGGRYTGLFNVVASWTISGGYSPFFVYTASLEACGAGGCRLLASSAMQGASGTLMVSGVSLSNESLRLTLGYNVSQQGFCASVLVSATVQLSDSIALQFAYWETPSGRVYSTTLTGTLSSNTWVTAVYAPYTLPTLNVTAEVANFTLPQSTTVSGILQVSGSPVSGILAFFGTSLRSSTLSAKAGLRSVYSESVPQFLVLTLTTDRVALLGSTMFPTTSETFYSAGNYTGTFNISISLTLVPPVSGTVSLDACTQGSSCRSLYSGSVPTQPGSLEPTVKNTQLSNERLKLSINLSSPSFITASVTLSNSSQKTFYFAYWDTPSGKVYSTTVSGSLVSSLRLTATYLPSSGINAALVLLPGMDFLPHNTTHFIPLMPGVYTVETNATVILLDASATRIYSVEGLNATVKVLSTFGEPAKVGTTRKSSRLPATTLPIVLIGNQTFYLFSLTAPETPNSTIYLKVNNSIYIYRVVAPRIEVTEIDYGWDAVRIHFNAYPSWGNYNITALLDGKELSSATASAGVLEVRYEELQGVTTPRTIELAPSWGGRLEIPGERPKLLLLPVAVELSFHNGSGRLVLTASEPRVLGVNATLRQELIAVNETPNMGKLCIKLVNASNQAVWQVCVPYPYVAEVPYPDTSGHFLEVVYVPAPTKRVIVFPWWERL